MAEESMTAQTAEKCAESREHVKQDSESTCEQVAQKWTS